MNMNKTEMVRELMRQLKNDLDRDQSRIREVREMTKAEKEYIREAEGRIAEMKDQLATLEGMLSAPYSQSRSALVMPSPIREDSELSSSSKSSSSSDEGIMRIPPEQIQDTKSWFPLVDDGRLLRCPCCKINAQIRSAGGGKEIQYFKGTSGLIAHVTKNHPDEAARIKDVGRGGVAAYIRKSSRPLTKDEAKAYDNDLPGVYIETYVPFDTVYTNWRKQVINSKPPVNGGAQSRKRPREQESSQRVHNAGASQSVNTLPASQNSFRNTLLSRVMKLSRSPPDIDFTDAGSTSTNQAIKRRATENSKIINMSPTPPSKYHDSVAVARQERANIWIG